MMDIAICHFARPPCSSTARRARTLKGGPAAKPPLPRAFVCRQMQPTLLTQPGSRRRSVAIAAQRRTRF